jgi:hypothetical protein
MLFFSEAKTKNAHISPIPPKETMPTSTDNANTTKCTVYKNITHTFINFAKSLSSNTLNGVKHKCYCT